MSNHRARIKDLEGQGHFQKGHFRLRRALWLLKLKGTKAIQEKAQRSKKKKGQQIQRGGGGGRTPTHFFSDFKKKKTQKAKKKKKKKLADSSAQLTPLHSMQNALQCQWHALWSASAWNYVDKWQNIYI